MVTATNMSMAAGSRALAAAARLSQTAAGPSPALLTQLRCAIPVLQLATSSAHDSSMFPTINSFVPQSFCDGPGVFWQAVALHRGHWFSRRAREQPRCKLLLTHILDTNLVSYDLRYFNQILFECVFMLVGASVHKGLR